MCGIFAIIDSTNENTKKLRKIAVKEGQKIQHRGPDNMGIDVYEYTDENGTKRSTILIQQLLAIQDVISGEQPLYDTTGEIVVIANGEIYNHLELKKLLPKEIQDQFKTASDCEVIAHLYNIMRPEEFVEKLDGMFSFVILDKKTGECFIARDPIGITSLYYGTSLEDDSMWISSEMKCLQERCKVIKQFPPGHYYSTKTKEFVRYYEPVWWDESNQTETDEETIGEDLLKKIRTGLEEAVKKRMMCNVPYGVLLSGGLDSSLVTSICCQYAPLKVSTGGSKKAWFPTVHSFSIGLKESPDLAKAREVADFLGTIHHEFYFTPQQGIDVIPDVIKHIETYDVTTIRASTPMFILSRKIKAMGIKMVLSGEGIDEALGGYLYFHKAPTPDDFHRETVRKLKLLNYFDCLRANKSSMSFGVEVRVPFLDEEFLNTIMTLPPKFKMVKKGTDQKIEKYILRKAFDTSRYESLKDTPWEPFLRTDDEESNNSNDNNNNNNDDENNSPPGYGNKIPRTYLPHSVLYRQKEQFSDGVGYNWIDTIQAHADETVTDEELENAEITFPVNTPKTKEAYWYRTLFNEAFPNKSSRYTVHWEDSIACSTSIAIEWDESFKNQNDPSGRAVLGVHVDDLILKK
eukprot:TRINITY_DN1163_c0_g4_i1.p1 TRINITY_DN1163_c0_g4~~TRINITY_DN1163_c0_g4_i1.p1  ORF type:complete len:632 (-),score=271.51 TRINITY_DN1163_c0_g4_i1:290-2185(-)